MFCLTRSGDAAVLVVDGKIDSINGSTSADEVDSVAKLVPGFIDLHIHGAVNVDVLDADSSDLGLAVLAGVSLLTANVCASWMITRKPD